MSEIFNYISYNDIIHVDNYNNNSNVTVIRFNPDNFWLVV